MLHRVMMLTAGLLGAALLAPAEGVAQDKPAVKWGPPVAIRGQDAVKERKPRRGGPSTACGMPCVWATSRGLCN